MCWLIMPVVCFFLSDDKGEYLRLTNQQVSLWDSKFKAKDDLVGFKKVPFTIHSLVGPQINMFVSSTWCNISRMMIALGDFFGDPDMTCRAVKFHKTNSPKNFLENHLHHRPKP